MVLVVYGRFRKSTTTFAPATLCSKMIFWSSLYRSDSKFCFKVVKTPTPRYIHKPGFVNDRACARVPWPVSVSLSKSFEVLVNQFPSHGWLTIRRWYSHYRYLCDVLVSVPTPGCKASWSNVGQAGTYVRDLVQLELTRWKLIKNRCRIWPTGNLHQTSLTFLARLPTAPGNGDNVYEKHTAWAFRGNLDLEPSPTYRPLKPGLESY